MEIKTHSEVEAKWDTNVAFKFITQKQTHNGSLKAAEMYSRIEIESTRNVPSPDRIHYRAENVISVEQRISWSYLAPVK